MCEIKIDVEQLNLIYSDGIPNFRSAINNFGEGATIAGKALRFFNVDYLERYLPNAADIGGRILSFQLDSEGLLIGENTFSTKIASYLMYMAEIDDKLDLSDYPELASYIQNIRDKNMDYMDFKMFDEKNLAMFTKWYNDYNDAAVARKEQIQKFRELGDEVEVDELRNKLKEAGYSDEEINRIISSFPTTEDGKRIKLSSGIIAVFAFGVSLIASGFKDAVVQGAGHVGDQFFNFTDTPAWLANGPLIQLYESLGAGTWAGAAAALTIGTVLAFQDGEFDFETWLEEGFAAACGSVASSLALNAVGGSAAIAAMGIAGLGVMAGILVLGIGVTLGVSEFIKAIFNLPGGVPKDFDSWDEKEKRKYLSQVTGIDIKKLEMLEKLMDSKDFDDEEIIKLYDVCTRDYSLEIGNVADENDYIKVAFYIYMNDKSHYDNSEFVLDDYMLRSADMFGVDDYQKIAEYIERFKSVLKNS